MIEFLTDLRNVIDAPPEALLACPAGLVAALHFASASEEQVKGARVDAVAAEARARAFHRPAWVKTLGVGLGLLVAITSFLHIQDPQLMPSWFNSLPI